MMKSEVMDRKIIILLAVVLANVFQSGSIVISNVAVMHIQGDNNQFVDRGWQPEEGENIMTSPVTQSMDVQINLQESVGFTGPRFVGVAIDASFFREKWKDFDVYSKTVRSLAQGLTPSFLRMGGTAADFLIFNATAPGAAVCDKCHMEMAEVDKPKEKNFTLSGTDWERLNFLVQEASWDLIFDVNVFLRKGQVWDPDNARQLLQFSQERNYSIPCFQLGNEPNAYYHNFHFKITPSRMVADMRILKSVLSDFPQYRNSCLIGPEVTKVTKGSALSYFEGFFKAQGQKVVKAATLHHYYFNAEESGVHLSDFFNATILDSLNQELQTATSIVQKYDPSLPLWFSETSSVSGGGLPGTSDAYAAGFMWMDKLGLSARYGLQTVIRQTFYKGDYSLVADDLTPNPDYFLTVLYKRLVQGHVLTVLTSTETVRVYAHCANTASYSAGALTVYALNIQSDPVTLNLTQFSDQSLDLYLLTPGDQDGLNSKYVALNGNRLVMFNEELPPMPPQTHTGPVTIVPYSFGFVVVPWADVQLCKS